MTLAYSFGMGSTGSSKRSPFFKQFPNFYSFPSLFSPATTSPYPEYQAFTNSLIVISALCASTMPAKKTHLYHPTGAIVLLSSLSLSLFLSHISSHWSLSLRVTLNVRTSISRFRLGFYSPLICVTAGSSQLFATRL